MPTAVIVPASPALVPVVAGRTPELDDARSAARAAVQHLVATRPPRVVAVASAPHDADETWTVDLGAYGLPAATHAGRPLPVAFATAAWLLDQAGWEGPRAYVRPGPVELGEGDGVVVVADGTACRSERAPGHLDPRAEGVDARLASALEAGDLGVLDELDEVVAQELLMGGLPALGWLRDATSHRQVAAELSYSGAPLGVGLWVARWTWGDLTG